MFTFFLVLAIVAALVLFPAVLLQAGQGGGLSAQFGGGSSTDAFVGGRQAATILHRASWWAGGGFLAICFILQLLGSRTGAPRSLTEEQLRSQAAQQAAPAPLSPQAPAALPLQQPGQQAAPAPATPAPGSSKQPAR